MMKRRINSFIIIALAAVMVLAAAVAANAWSEYARVQDFAAVLSDAEKSELESYLDLKTQTLNFDIVVITTGEGYTQDNMMKVADDYYDQGGYGYGDSHDGCLLLVDFNSRNIWLSTTGYGITALTDYGIDELISGLSDPLASERYYEAFTVHYADKVESLVNQARSGQPYDVPPRNPVNALKDIENWFRWIIVAAALGLVWGLIVGKKNKAALTSVRFRNEAANYVRQGGLNLRGKSDMFLYSNVVRTAKPKDDGHIGGSSTHIGSSGTTHGGGGGRF